MSEHPSEPSSAETASVNTQAPSGVRTEPVVTDAPAIAPDQELIAPVADAPKAEIKVEPKAEPKVEAPRVEPKIEAASKPEAARSPGKVMIMSPGDRSWRAEPKTEAEPVARRGRVPAMAAIVAFATVAGALGGALVTAGLGHGSNADVAATRNVGLEAAIARIDADVLALKASAEQNAKAGVSHFNKTSDRLDKVEKAQAEPAARLAKLSEEVNKLRAAQASVAVVPVAAAPAAAAAPMQVAAVPAAKDVTGTVTPPANAAMAPAPNVAATAAVARLPTVEGWVLRDAAKGSALIEGRRGLFEVYAGDSIPGVGRVDAIRKQDGQWVVVTSKGLIVAR